jgi:glyceraldehyde-3-phosphate dehydrogenase (NADP+)
MVRAGPLIDGKTRPTGRIARIHDPWSGEPFAEVEQAGPAEVEAAILAAVRAFEKTRGLSRGERSAFLAGAAAAVERCAEELARIVRKETGKPISLARWEVQRCRTTFALAAEEARRFSGELLPADILPRYEGYRALYERFPVGPILGIVPFNFPLNLAAHKIAPALATGNPIVLKPAPQTPLSALRLAECLTEAGAPPGSIAVVPCPDELAEAMVRDERFRMLSFTGSAHTGWRLKELAGRKRVTLELGGNAALVVEADADLERAAEKAAFGAFAFAGQACISVQRIYVQRRVFDAFLERLCSATDRLGVGDPDDEATVVGPMASPQAADRVLSWIEEAIANGARAVRGATRTGSLVAPTILVDARPEMRVCCEEVFGPVVTVCPYDDLAEAVAAVNASRFGLQAGIFTFDVRKIDYAFRRIEVGTLLVNETPYFRIDSLPFGGVKESGFGREGVRFAMESMTEPKALVIVPA